MTQENTFDFDEFAALPTYTKQRRYAKERLRYIAEGSSRIAFLCGSRVFKVAKNKAGVAQNKVEANSPFQGERLFARIYKRGEKFEWVLMELCEEVNFSDFYQYFGMCSSRAMGYFSGTQWEDFRDKVFFEVRHIPSLCEYFAKPQGSRGYFRDGHIGTTGGLQWLVGAVCGEIDPETGKPFSAKGLTNFNQNFIDFLTDLRDWVEKYKPTFFDYGDYSAIENWGMSCVRLDHKLVIIDFGFNDEVNEKFYN